MPKQPVDLETPPTEPTPPPAVISPPPPDDACPICKKPLPAGDLSCGGCGYVKARGY